MLQLQTYSTEGMPQRQRLEYWNDVTCSALSTPQVADPVDPIHFCGRMTYLNLGDMRFVELDASGSTVTRSRTHMSSSPQAVYLFRLQLRGETLTVHDGREIRLRPGDFALYDTTRPYKIYFRESSNNLILRVPRERLLQYIARPEAVVSVVMPGDSGLSGLASRHVRELWRNSADFLSHGASPRIGEITMQLLASAYSEIPQIKADRSCLAAAHRAQIVELIERRLSEPDLTPSKIASELRLTPGYLHRLFAGESDTISRYILRRRLEKCASALKDPLQAHRSVTSIAFSYGFNSLPHFSRVFRERYNLSPTEYRQ